MYETIVVVTVVSIVGYYSYLAGKQDGSRKRFGAGRYGRK